MKHLVFESCLSDTDVWMHDSTREYGTKYNEYVLLYVDDWLVISDKFEDIFKKYIELYFELKEESIFPPSLYLGGKMRQVVLENLSKAWAFGYVQLNLQLRFWTRIERRCIFQKSLALKNPHTTNYLLGSYVGLWN